MKKHFGTAPLKRWIDSRDWRYNFKGYFEDLDSNEQKEVDKAIVQFSSSLLLRFWQEVCQLFLHYLCKSPSSPFKKVSSIISRNEYQAKAGNLSHIHLILQVDYENLSLSEKKINKR